MLPLRAMLVSVVHAATGGHVGVCGPGTARGHVDVHDLCYHQRPRGFPRSVLQPETILMSMGHVAAGGHVDGEWPVPPPEAMLISLACATTRG